ncbi:hypothetical protein TrVE_jg9185 [Triparma verrucosa]|uniref:Uncharacterized protein n=1 Tax=Triparma verrucosa TaxID=1606542 RepID=A0A9W7C6J9_9STRA|nr:hypothetical protein TrVE_jg9185 [Triparma verrucosa]
MPLPQLPLPQIVQNDSLTPSLLPLSRRLQLSFLSSTSLFYLYGVHLGLPSPPSYAIKSGFATSIFVLTSYVPTLYIKNTSGLSNTTEGVGYPRFKDEWCKGIKDCITVHVQGCMIGGAVCGILHHKRLLAGPRGSLLGASIGVIWGIAEWEYMNAKENYRRERIKDFYPEVIRSRGKE